MAPVLAHQGGWDEVLFVLVPVAVFAVLLWITSRRAPHPPLDDPDHEPEHHPEA